MDRFERAELDRHITGDHGEDSVPTGYDMSLADALDYMSDLAGDRTYDHWADAARIVLAHVAELEAIKRQALEELKRVKSLQQLIVIRRILAGDK